MVRAKAGRQTGLFALAGNRESAMKTAWLRALIRKYGAAGILLVGCYLLLHHLWHRRRGLLALCAVTVYLAYAWMSRPPQQKPAALPDAATPTRVTYTLTDLGKLPGCGYSLPLDINDKGQVVGYAEHSEEGLHA